MALPGCGDSVVGVPVPDEPGEATLADFRTGPLVEPSAFSWIVLSTVRTDQSSQWDFAFALEVDSQGQVEQLHALARDVYYGRRGRVNARRTARADELLQLPHAIGSRCQS